MNDLISVIVPIFNSEKTVERCVNSILNQTYNDLEIILINDGSSDSSGEICEKLKKQDDRIVVVHQSNSGVVKTIKKGLRISSGSYIGFVDSDDFIEPEMYEVLYRAIINNKADYAHSLFYDSFGKYRQFPQKVNIAIDRVSFLKEYVFDADTRMRASRCTNLYKRQLIIDAYSQIRNYCQRGEDAEIMISTALIADMIAFVSHGYYHYVYYTDSESKSKDLGKFKEAAAWYDDIKRIINEKGLLSEIGYLIDEYYKAILFTIISDCYGDDLFVIKWVYPELSDIKDKRVVLFAGGSVGSSYYHYFISKEICHIVAWVDTKNEKYHNGVVSPDCIPDLVFDYVIIAVSDRHKKEEIMNILIKKYRVPKRKILWKKPISICKIHN